MDNRAILKRNDIKKSEAYQSGFLEETVPMYDAYMALKTSLIRSHKKANLVVTDPPYNVNYKGTAGTIQNDNWTDGDAFYHFLLDAFTNMEKNMASDASIYVFHADTEGLNFRKAFVDAGFYLSGCCIWKKPSLVLGHSPYQWQHEPCLFGWKKEGKHQWYAGRKETTIWEFEKSKKNGEHPTMKEYQRQYDGYAERFNRLTARHEELQTRKTILLGRADAFRLFIGVLKKRDGLLSEFDDTLWQCTVKTATVNKDGSILFEFYNGSEIRQ